MCVWAVQGKGPGIWGVQSKDQESASTQSCSCQGPFLKLTWMSPQWCPVLFPISTFPAGLHWYPKTALASLRTRYAQPKTQPASFVSCYKNSLWWFATQPSDQFKMSWAVTNALYRSTRWGSKEIHRSTLCGVDRASLLQRDTVSNYACMNHAAGLFFV